MARSNEMALQLSYTDANGITHDEAYTRVRIREYRKNSFVRFFVDIFPSAENCVVPINGGNVHSRLFQIENRDREMLDEQGDVVATVNDFETYKARISDLEEAGRTLEASCYDYLKGEVALYVNAIDV